MKVIFVGAGPGDPELLTVRAKNILGSCSYCIYAGSLVSPQVLSIIPESASTFNSAELNLDEITELFKNAREMNLDVVRLHSGDPSIYGAIREQMNELDKLGIDYEVVPGVSSFQAAAAALKTELTAPEISQTIVLTRSSGRTPMPAPEELKKLAESRSTMCIFLSAHKIESVVNELKDVYGPECPAAIVAKATWPEQQIVSGKLADIAQKAAKAGINKTALVIVGKALSRDAQPSRLYASDFTHEFRMAQD
jgi:precorrin-4/cobalt-precorrin-4 C11-methyltransferase